MSLLLLNKLRQKSNQRHQTKSLIRPINRTIFYKLKVFSLNRKNFLLLEEIHLSEILEFPFPNKIIQSKIFLIKIKPILNPLGNRFITNNRLTINNYQSTNITNQSLTHQAINTIPIKTNSNKHKSRSKSFNQHHLNKDNNYRQYNLKQNLIPLNQDLNYMIRQTS